MNDKLLNEVRERIEAKYQAALAGLETIAAFVGDADTSVAGEPAPPAGSFSSRRYCGGGGRALGASTLKAYWTHCSRIWASMASVLSE